MGIDRNIYWSGSDRLYALGGCIQKENGTDVVKITSSDGRELKVAAQALGWWREMLNKVQAFLGFATYIKVTDPARESNKLRGGNKLYVKVDDVWKAAKQHSYALKGLMPGSEPRAELVRALDYTEPNGEEEYKKDRRILGHGEMPADIVERFRKIPDDKSVQLWQPAGPTKEGSTPMKFVHFTQDGKLQDGKRKGS